MPALRRKNSFEFRANLVYITRSHPSHQLQGVFFFFFFKKKKKKKKKPLTDYMCVSYITLGSTAVQTQIVATEDQLCIP